MEREIKFRAWNHIVNRMSDCYTLEQLHKEKVNFVNVIFLQYTGLKDKNGKEIYEGDIVSSKPKDSRWDALKCKIVFNENTARFEAQQYWENKGLFLSLSNNHDYYEYEVIGNIYQNPKLLN